MYSSKRLWLNRDENQKEAWQGLMKASSLSTDIDLDYVIGIYDTDSGRLMASGGFQENIIKGVAVCKDAQSGNLLNTLITELVEEMKSRGIQKYFVYSKPANIKYFKALGFRLLVETSDVIFMEMGLPTFNQYISSLSENIQEGNNGAIVMNANPFTKGHRYLIEYAASHSDQVIVFVLSEDRSQFTSEDRINMVKAGTRDLENVHIFETKDYMVSQATFPTYFLKDFELNEKKTRAQAQLDASLFKESIAPALNIKTRYVGEEPYSQLTDIYNQAMREIFGDDLNLTIIPRLSINDDIISATKVRKYLNEGDSEKAKIYLPESTIEYLDQKGSFELK